MTLVLAAPTQVWSGADGQVRPGGAQGLTHGDRRLLDRLVLTVDDEEPTPVAAHPDGAVERILIAQAALPTPEIVKLFER